MGKSLRALGLDRHIASLRNQLGSLVEQYGYLDQRVLEVSQKLHRLIVCAVRREIAGKAKAQQLAFVD
jgi:hypothetical protein